MHLGFTLLCFQFSLNQSSIYALIEVILLTAFFLARLVSSEVVYIYIDHVGFT